MKTLSFSVLLCVSLLASTSVFSQTFTMGKKCRASLETAQTALHNKKYSDALDNFNTFSSDCKTKDAKEVGAYGKAEALNGLGRYEEAITEADKALKITKNQSLNGHFQKGVALNKLGKIEESKTELDQVLQLTQKNQNVAERASNYALMAALYDRQMGDIKAAQEYINEAKKLDPNNAEYVIQEGSMYADKGDYNKAFQIYDEAEKLDSNSKDLYIAKSNTRLKQIEGKYGTSEAQDLRDKMSDKEKQLLCADMKKAQALGWNDMSKDLFVALICK